MLKGDELSLTRFEFFFRILIVVVTRPEADSSNCVAIFSYTGFREVGRNSGAASAKTLR